MKHTVLFMTTLAFIFSLALSAQQQTSDGGFIIAGGTESYGSGNSDFLIYKLSATGAKEWRKSFGSQYYENATAIQQTADGGYIVAGISDSYSEPPGGSNDFLLYKLNASGQKEWRKVYGGDESDHVYGVIQTSDGGYLVIGDTYNYVHGTPNNDADFLVYKLDAAGNKQWRKNYGGTSWDYGLRAVQTSDGGYVFIGYSESYTSYNWNFLVYKVDASGNKQWRKDLGGTSDDYGMFIRQTSDGGYILCGYTYSYIHTPTPGRTKLDPSADILVYKLDASGAKLWRKNYGGYLDDVGYDIRQTPEGGYVFCGQTQSYTNGGSDMLVYKVSAGGAKQWRKNYGGIDDEYGYFIVPTSDGGYFIFGTSDTYTNGGSDFLVYKVNAAGQKQWRKNYGGTNHEWVELWD